jgi:peptidoglycan hydrolase-like protein with peptidoglycan-binding domain
MIITRHSAPDAIASLQLALKDQGFDPGDVDGILGKRTTAAIRAFQRVHGIRVDGVAGQQTLQAMQNTIAPRVPRARPDLEASLRPFDPSKDSARQNPDGSYSTEVTRTVQTPSGWANVPSLWWDSTGHFHDLGKMSDDELADFAGRYEQQNNVTFPRFRRLDDAVAAAQIRSAGGGASHSMLAAPSIGEVLFGKPQMPQTFVRAPVAAPSLGTEVTAPSPAAPPTTLQDQIAAKRAMIADVAGAAARAGQSLPPSIAHGIAARGITPNVSMPIQGAAAGSAPPIPSAAAVADRPIPVNQAAVAPPPQQAPVPQPAAAPDPVDLDRLIAEKKAAILQYGGKMLAAGMNPDPIMQRLQQAGIVPAQ